MDYVFQNEYLLFFVMELIQGGELRELLDQYDRFEEKAVKFYAVQILDAVNYLHE